MSYFLKRHSRFIPKRCHETIRESLRLQEKGVNLFSFPVGGPQGKGILLPHVVLDILKKYSIFTKKKSQENSL